MLCDECYEYSDEYENMRGNTYCTKCINKYKLIQCPGYSCNSTISLNGYDDIEDIEENTCTECDTIFCNNCLVRARNLLLCKDCFNS